MYFSSIADWRTLAQRHLLRFNLTQIAGIKAGHPDTPQEHP